MADIYWNLAKSDELKRKRGVSFEEIMKARLLSVMKHPSRPHQKIMLFMHKGYIWVVPYVVRKKEIFLKTLFPSRKYTKLWIRGELK
ncbi:toxin [Elusimicrobiota bacterium]